MPNGSRKLNKSLVSICRKIEKGKPVDMKGVLAVLDGCGCDVQEVLTQHVSELLSTGGNARSGDPSVRGIPITATTVQSSKGLSADFVFITHCDDQYVVKDKDKSKISDRDVCNFLVALTRARKRVHIISSNQSKVPQFVEWFADGRTD